MTFKSSAHSNLITKLFELSNEPTYIYLKKKSILSRLMKSETPKI